MTTKAIKLAVIVLGVACASLAHAATDWSTQDYDLYPGDFNGDGKSDLLYVAKSPEKGSGIALSNGSQPVAGFQPWASNEFGIPWHSNIYKPIIGDFNGDGLDDILMQRQSPGDSYVLFANSDEAYGAVGQFRGISQAISYVWGGLISSADQHIIVAGEFNGQVGTDVLFQATGPGGTHGIFAGGVDGLSSSYTSVSDGAGGFRLNARNSILHPGDFNGDGRTDLLVQAKPDIVMIDYDIPIPVPVYRPGSYGILYSPLGSGGQQIWNRMQAGVDWSPNASNIVIGDFNGDGRDDVIVQSKRAGGPTYVVQANSAGSLLFDSPQALTFSGVGSASGDSYRLIASDFDGAQYLPVNGIYLQASSASGTNFVANDIPVSGGTASTTAQSQDQQFVPTPGTAVGSIPGQFGVDPSGAATYRMPIAVPPGIAGLAPDLALSYSSRAGNGLLGVGWSISGLSAISRCATVYETDGFTDGVDFDSNDRYCLDGQHLVTNPGSSGTVGAEYRTEIESFKRVESVGGVAHDPLAWVVRDKAGLIHYYGYTTDSRIQPQGRTQASIWAINKIQDRYGNFIEFTYTENSSESNFAPSEIRWGSEAAGRNVVGRARFEYVTNRSDVTHGYFAGGVVRNDKRLQRVDVFSRPSATSVASDATVLVSSYYLRYVQSPTSALSHLTEVVLCDGAYGASKRCVGSTKFDWQYGTAGFGAGTDTGMDVTQWYVRPLNTNSDGRTDFLTSNWQYIPGYGSEFSTGRVLIALATGWGLGGVGGVIATYGKPWDTISIDWDSDGYDDLVHKNGGNYELNRTVAGGTVPGISTGISAQAITPSGLQTAVGDFDGDGTQDLIYAPFPVPPSGSYSNLPMSSSLQLHLNSPGGFSQQSSANYRSIALNGIALTRNGLGPYVETLDGPKDGELQAVSVINLDGDGRDDVLVHVGTGCTRSGGFRQTPRYQCSGRQYNVYSYDPVAGTLALVWSVNNEVWAYPKFADFNGDGLTDVVYESGGWWRLRVGTGTASQGLKQTSWTPWNNTYFDASRLRYTQVIDNNRDGLPDLLIPQINPGAAGWFVLASTGNGFANTLGSVQLPSDIPESAMVVDHNGDGLADLMYRSGVNGSSNMYRIAFGRGTAPGLMTRITDGMSAAIQVEHRALTHSGNGWQAVQYGGHTDFLDLVSSNQSVGFPYVNGLAPLNVVSQISQDTGLGSPGSAVSSIHTAYKYEGLKAHRRGRGLLGFSRITTRNLNTNIVTVREFAQRWPLVGILLNTVQRHPETYSLQDVTVNVSETDAAACLATAELPELCPSAGQYVDQQYVLEPARNITTSLNSLSWLSWTYPGQSSPSRWFPQVLQTIETIHPEGGGAALKRTITDYLGRNGVAQSSGNNAHDDYGNPYYIRVTVDDGNGGDPHVTSTEHWYSNDTSANWCLGRLSETRVTHSKSLALSGNTGAQTINRKSTFTYRPAPYCSLETETLEPDDNSVKQLTTYGYDSYGNRSSATTQLFHANAPASRSTYSDYSATQGQFPGTVTNALGHQEAYAWDPRFGVKTDSTGPNGITSHVDYDTFGRVVRETPVYAVAGGSGLGIYKETKRYWCKYIGCYDTRSVMAVVVTASDGSQSRSEVDRLGRETYSGKIALDGRWLASEQHYDPLGRAYAVSQPYFDSTKKCWTFNRFDLLNRVTYQRTAYKTGDNSDSECTATVPAYDASDSALPGGAGGGRVTYFTHDMRTGSLIGTKTESNPSDPVARRVALKWVNVFGRTRVVQDEVSSGGCADNAASSGTGTSGNCLATFYDHDAQGNLTLVRRDGRIANGGGMANTTIDTHASFNIRGFKTGMSDPDMGVWSYTYNGYGELVSQTDAKGQVTALTYDGLGRMRTRIETGEGTTTWTYDDVATGGPRAIGKLTSVVAPGGFEERYTYDNYGRAETTRRLIDGYWYRIDQTYDAQGRVDLLKYPSWNATTSPSTLPADNERVVVRSNYNGYGYLTSTQNVGTSTTLWRVDATDLYGITRETLGNGVVTRRVFEATTGYLRQVQAGLGSGTAVQDQRFQFDRNGNVMFRADANLSRSEDFTYDSIDRLTQTRLFNNASASGSPASTETMYYDDFGNIRNKGNLYSGYNYTVDTTGTCGARATNQGAQPHAVRQLVAGSVTRTLCYDANGNVVSQQNGQYDTATWTVANLAKRISKGTGYADFSYGPDRARFKQVAVQGSTAITTLYVGGVYEKVTRGSITEHIYYLKGGGGAIAIYKRTINGSSTTGDTRYLHRDHLGSVVAISDANGSVPSQDRMSFDAWGKRRANTWTATAAGTQIDPSTYTSFTNRGYTGHEHLDFLGVIHMNGRVYDSDIGRFLSADPFVQYPESTQGFNRYSYVDNNPLSATDPSGFMSLRQFVGTVLQIVGGILIGTGYFAAVGYLLVAVGGYMTDGPRGAVLGLVSAGIFSGISSIPNVFIRAVVAGIAGGILSVAVGGSFGDGFIGGFAGAIAGEAMARSNLGAAGTGTTGQKVLRVVVRAVVGGTISEIGGGSFANGAIAAAFGAAIEESALSTNLRTYQGSRESGGDSSAQLTVSQEKVIKQLEAGAQNVMNDLEVKIAEAYAKNDFKKATELRDAWFKMFKVRAFVDFSAYAGPDIAVTNTKIAKMSDGSYVVKDIEMIFHAGKVQDMYLNGSTASKMKGYKLDYPPGDRGVRMLILHELRHGFAINHFDPSGIQRTPWARERDADTFIRGIY